MPENTPDTQIGSDGERYPTGTQPTDDPFWYGNVMILGDLSGVTDGQVVAYDDATGTWIPANNAGGGGGGASEMNDLSDVNAPSPSDDDVLIYSSGAWSPTTLDHEAIVDFNDGVDDIAPRKDELTTKGDIYVATAASTPERLAAGTNGQVLKVNDATSSGLEWAAESGGSVSMDDITDVDTSTTSPEQGDLLAYNGTLWVPTPNFQDVLDEIGTGNLVHEYDWSVASGNITDSVGSQPFVITVGGGSATYAQDSPLGTGTAVALAGGAQAATAAIGSWPTGGNSRTVIWIFKAPSRNGGNHNIAGYGTQSTDDAFFFKQGDTGEQDHLGFTGWGSDADFRVNGMIPLDGGWHIVIQGRDSSDNTNFIHGDLISSSKQRTLTTGSSNTPRIPYSTSIDVTVAGTWVYDVALTSDQIYKLINAFLRLRDHNL